MMLGYSSDQMKCAQTHCTRGAKFLMSGNAWALGQVLQEDPLDLGLVDSGAWCNARWDYNCHQEGGCTGV